MPYISWQVRQEMDRALKPLLGLMLTPGELNYVITTILLRCGCPADYSDYNSLLGVLECVKLELYRRRVAPYEDKKKEENGDVY